MKREHEIMCRDNQELKGKDETNMLLQEESRPQISPGKKAPASIHATTKHKAPKIT
jgi:hypothetical protein